MAELLRILERTNTMSRAESTLVGPGADWLNCSRISTNHGHRFQSRATLCAFDPHLRKKSVIARFEESVQRPSQNRLLLGVVRVGS